MAQNRIRLDTVQQKGIYEQFKFLSNRHTRWEIWSDFIKLSACSLCLSDREQHEKEYATIIKRYDREEIERFSQMLAFTVDAFEYNPDQDFLGDLFMRLDLSDTWRGQFFTPYNVCKMMAGINIEEPSEEQQWISVCDPACGAGALLIAFAQECLHRKINYQTSVLFVAQDIDRIAALMCFIQLSLLGCPGYVVIGDSLTNPVTGKSLLLPSKQPGQEIWYTPMFFSDIWQRRIAIEKR